jgi:2-polyprenyl-3-methyl-5-hydroxy-6-metoxy-1,4-benzoquinol methylase
MRKGKKKGIEVHICDLNNPSMKIEGVYDYILLSEVLEHLITPQEVLKKCLSCAKKGVIVTIPNSGWFGYRLQYLMGRFPRQSFTHLHYWTHGDFLMFCNTLNIEVIDFKVPNNEGILAKVFPNLFAYSLCYFLRQKNQTISNEVTHIR